MITLQVADYCHDCVDFEPEKVNYCAYMFDTAYRHDIRVVCKHREHCAYLRQKWEQELLKKRGE